jgi:ABC-2 type transport system permease protein
MSSTSTRTRTSAPPAGGGLPGAVAAEWTKLWSLRSTTWALLGAVVLMALVATQVALNPALADRAEVRPSELALEAGVMAQLVVVALAMLVVTGEYATGSIRSSLQWVPRRGRLLLAKAAVVAPVTFAVGVVQGLVGSAAAAPWLGTERVLRVGDVVADVLLLGVCTALVCLLTLGVGTVLRSSVGTLTAVFVVLLVLPMLLGTDGRGGVAQVLGYLPGSAGLDLLGSEGGPGDVAVDLLVLAAWAGAALLAGARALASRDA